MSYVIKPNDPLSDLHADELVDLSSELTRLVIDLHHLCLARRGLRRELLAGRDLASLPARMRQLAGWLLDAIGEPNCLPLLDPTNTFPK